MKVFIIKYIFVTFLAVLGKSILSVQASAKHEREHERGYDRGERKGLILLEVDGLPIHQEHDTREILSIVSWHQLRN